mgnify:CR=1 FL=1
MRADKPIGIYLLLWPALWGLLLAAQGFPPWDLLIIFCLGTLVMRSAGCVINDYADRKVDGSVQRTQNRPLAKGRVSPAEALQLFALLIAIAFVLVLFLNWQTQVLSLVALLLASVYPFMKRYTHLPQVVLGAAFGWSIPMAFMATTGELPVWIWYVYLANLCWTVAYDTQYAMVDRDYDLQIGVKSTAILFGRFDLIAIAVLQVIALVLLSYVFYINHMSIHGYFGLGLAAMLFLYQWNLCKNRDEVGCFSAFLHNNWVGMAITVSVIAGIFL